MSDLMPETTTRDDGRTAPRVRAREGLGAPCVQFGAAWKRTALGGNVAWLQQPAKKEVVPKAYLQPPQQQQQWNRL